MSNYNQLLNSGIQAVDNYYIDITTGASNENTELLGNWYRSVERLNMTFS